MKQHKKHKRRKKQTQTRSITAKGVLYVVGFALPYVLYLVITQVLLPARNTGFLLLGYLGAGILGIANALLIALCFRKIFVPRDLIAVGLVFMIGLLFLAASVVLIYVPGVYAAFHEEYVTYYFVMWIFLSAPCISYCFFRHAIHLWLRRGGISNTAIKKLKKGARNAWFYREIHAKYNMGANYWVNMAFLVVFPALVAVQSLFGWYLPFAGRILTPLYAICSCLCVYMALITQVELSEDEFGSEKVWLAHRGRTRKWHGYSTSAYAIAAAGFHVILMIALIRLTQ